MAGGEKIVPLVDFTGYPDGIKTEFNAGVEATVPTDYAAMLHGKSPKIVAGKKSAKTDANPAD